MLMVIAVASGKGGTGKTTIATNLAFVAAAGSQPVQLVDCDVDEPNCHIFLNPTITETHTEELLRPQVDQAACTLCGSCEATCRFHAIVCMKQQVLLFEHLCHGCGACAMVCPEKAIDEVPQPLGVVELGRAGAIHFVQGRLEVREARSAMLVRAVRRYQMLNGLVILDAPPGTACPVVAAMHGVDRAVLVTEPTPFGLNDLKMAVGMLRQMSVPFAVVINQCDVGDARTIDYCKSEGIEILAQIPSRRDIAEAYAEGRLIAECVPRMRQVFEDLLAALQGVPA
jgi:MinD superfamily P-loop ATPase